MSSAEGPPFVPSTSPCSPGPRDVGPKKTPGPDLAESVQEPLRAISEGGRAEVPMSSHVVTALNTLLEEKKSSALSQKEKVLLSESFARVQQYLDANLASLVEEAEKSPTGAVSKSKASTGLPYTIRCFFDKETGKASISISFGKFEEGSEAKIKEVASIDAAGRLQIMAQRNIKKKEDRDLERERTSLSLVQGLAASGVPGLVEQTPVAYTTGKHRLKTASLSRKEPTTLLDFLVSSQTEAPGARQRKMLAIMTDLTKTVTAVHEKKVVHLDIKLENILLSKDGRPLLGDFGLAAKRGEFITPKGSFGWIAPELLLVGEEGTTANPATAGMKRVASIGVFRLTGLICGI